MAVTRVTRRRRNKPLSQAPCNAAALRTISQRNPTHIVPRVWSPRRNMLRVMHQRYAAQHSVWHGILTHTSAGYIGSCHSLRVAFIEFCYSLARTEGPVYRCGGIPATIINQTEWSCVSTAYLSESCDYDAHPNAPNAIDWPLRSHRFLLTEPLLPRPWAAARSCAADRRPRRNIASRAAHPSSTATAANRPRNGALCLRAEIEIGH